MLAHQAAGLESLFCRRCSVSAVKQGPAVCTVGFTASRYRAWGCSALKDRKDLVRECRRGGVTGRGNHVVG